MYFMATLGSEGERILQKKVGSEKKASAFYDKQMLDYLNPYMRAFILKQEMVFIATADSKGECDCSFRAGKQGFVRVLSKKTLLLPEYRGNGVMASMGNILKNPNIGMTFIDFFENTIGLHVNGKAKIIENDELLAGKTQAVFANDVWEEGTVPERWISITVEEAYIHCSKHIPHLKKLDKKIHWGTDKGTHKGGDFFKAETCE
jgi:predicted pyridoxine 5'-phosphate oxidase superfamily flavin-nucleotide-binding protein